jgi:RNA polymerase sigma-70 factor, ECF subfamily
MGAETALSSEEPSAVLDPGQVFRDEFSYVWGSLRRLGVFERDLEDVTHEVFLRVHAQLALFDPSRPLRPWLFGIALGVAANYRRLARHRTQLSDEIAEYPDTSANADEALELRERRRLVHAALEKVPLEQRAVLALHEMDGFGIPEVAHALGINVNTAYSRLRLGRQAFKQAVNRLSRGAGAR